MSETPCSQGTINEGWPIMYSADALGTATTPFAKLQRTKYIYLSWLFYNNSCETIISLKFGKMPFINFHFDSFFFVMKKDFCAEALEGDLMEALGEAGSGWLRLKIKEAKIF